MVFLFIVPSIPAVAGQLLPAADDRRQGRRLPAAEPAELVRLLFGSVFAVLISAGRRRHRLDLLHALLAPSHDGDHWRWCFMILAVFILGFSSIFTGINFVVTVHKLRARAWAGSTCPCSSGPSTPPHHPGARHAGHRHHRPAAHLRALFNYRHLRPRHGRRPGALPALLLVLQPPGGLHHDPPGMGIISELIAVHAARRSSATAPSPSARWASRRSASWSGATTCSPARASWRRRSSAP
jgi:hypothetical protein